MTSQPQNEQAHPLYLKEIASWTQGVCQEVKTKIRASIPALQRGLVWSPQQNELLWDSVLRGFPIGAVVVTKWSDKLKKSDEVADDSIKYHLLDGQQRCNAIALGFSDPFAAKESNDGKKAECILWLDLNLKPPKPDRNSTRGFWVRATTTAHPWGYRRDDSATPLTAGAIREALIPLGLDATSPDYQRPSPMKLWPCKAAADIPVPLSWLLLLPLDDETVFWNLLGQRAAEAATFKWTESVHEFCMNSQTAESKSRIFKGIKRADAARLIALEAPEELLDVSEQEKTSGSEREAVSNIEQLFQRLNGQGTKLDGEELAYSMIKAHWPELETEINKASDCRMPPARMVSLGVRAALAITPIGKDVKQTLPGPPTVSALRAMARSEEKSEEEKKEIIQKFIIQDLRCACDLVGHWLKYDLETNQSGLLPVHITSIAMSSREVYLLLLYFAKRMEGKDEPEGWRKTMQALATLIHWFAPEKAKVANRVYDACCREEPSIGKIQLALKAAIVAGEMYEMHTPTSVEAFVGLQKYELTNWRWEKLLQIEGDLAATERLRKSWEGFLNFRGNRELLLYAQRDFLVRRFRCYDPGRKDLWEAHNRPWDFDHILASYYFFNRKDGTPFRDACGQWGYTIGNLRAWPFEDNRSNQDQKAQGKLSVNGKLSEGLCNDSFINDPKQVDGFSVGNAVRSEEAAARLFVETCRKRLLRTYQEWYESVGVTELLEVDL
ncbi:MAG TPA: DUF262 domain-containing protein [Candidatus Saccharimonadales bacterium]|nr:DUF262 domain-containing protein [Candidatus Saccharimonadales bacterium]